MNYNFIEIACKYREIIGNKMHAFKNAKKAHLFRGMPIGFIHWSHSLVETMQFIVRLSVSKNIFLCGSLCILLLLCVIKIVLLHGVSQRIHREPQSFFY